ncbi:mitochondrial 37S ribosomal protein mS35 [Lodderomyces beijingensis]|uniref:Small ribosomal subunit protein mS35 mitochondrial conserved domain-containing protein n=1 Tax=Lodderomyces beijingensis TaxID=1775926 RepID=A0ABP0ZKH0_9ASCO
MKPAGLLQRLAYRSTSTAAAPRNGSVKLNKESPDLFLNPHAWKGLPADQIFQLHQIRKTYLGDAYNPTNEERTAILSTISSLANKGPALSYSFEIENFKERVMNNTPMKDRGKPQKLSNQPVLNTGEAPHHERRIENLTRIAAFEAPLLAKYRQEYKPQNKNKTPLRLIFNSDFTEQTSNKHNRKVTLLVKLKHLSLNEKQQHKFKILAGPRFHHGDGTFQLKCERYPEAAQNSTWLVDTFNKLLKEAKDISQETFEDIPLDKRHMKTLTRKPHPVFPAEWKRPADAPVRRHEIVNRLVDLTTERKDQEELNRISP